MGDALGVSVASETATAMPFFTRQMQLEADRTVFARNHARHAGDGYAFLDLERWDPGTGTLVAYGTQVMFLRFLDGAPSEPVRPTGS